MATNEFLPFCPTDTGTNLLTESEYTASADRVSGNKPGIATSKLNNKAVRQSAAITSQVAQYVSDTTGVNVLDDADSTKLLAQINAALKRFSPTATTYLSGSGTHNLSYIFAIVSGSATAGATYTHNAVTYTVVQTVAAGLYLRASGSAAPLVSGTLTKSGGTGDATITFYAFRAPLFLEVELAGGGGGGSGSSRVTSPDPGTGGTGGDSTFGTATASGGTGGAGAGGSGFGGTGGGTSLGTISGFGVSGGRGGGINTANTTFSTPGQFGGANSLGGAGGGFGVGTAGGAGLTNTGGGGAGGSSNSAGAGGGYNGSGGGAGGYIRGTITSPAATYSYAVGAAGTAGTAGTTGFAGGAGGSGILNIREMYQ